MSQRSRPIPAVVSAVQRLESRRLFASAVVTDGEFVLTGNATTPNTISVEYDAKTNVYVSTVNGRRRRVDAKGVIGLRVSGGTADDNVAIGESVRLKSVVLTDAGNDSVYGGSGSDNVFDTAGDNLFMLHGGDDVVHGGSGRDTVDAGAGNDIAFGNGGDDAFYGGKGDDYFDGGVGRDTSSTAAGDLTLNTENRTAGSKAEPDGWPGGANATLRRGTLTVTGVAGGGNVIRVTPDGGRLVVAIGSAQRSFAAKDVARLAVIGGGGADYVEISDAVALPVLVSGGNGNDTLYTSAGNDTVTGGDGDDRIVTQAGNDNVNAGDGNDTVESGSGSDVVSGGRGTDRIDGSGGRDTGADFEYSAFVERNVTTAAATPPAQSTGGKTTTGGKATPATGAKPTASTGVSPTPSISALDTTIAAGQAVFVNGLASRLGAGVAETARFEWDFGDKGSAYNSLVGFNAGHVYAKAGKYIVTLKLTNEKNVTKSASLTVNVAAAGRQTIYVSSSGNDSANGSAQSKAVKTVARAAALARGRANVDVLFRGGDTFLTGTTLELTGDNVRVGSYGSGKAVIRWNGARNGADIVRVTATATGSIVENVTLDSKFVGPDADRSGLPYAVNVKGKQTLVRGVTFLNVGFGVQTNAKPTGVMVQDSDSPTLYGLRNYFLWGQGSDFVIVGNKVANSTAEHPIRVFGVDRMLLAYNDLKNPQVYGFESLKTALNIQKGSYVYAFDNTLRGPRWQVGPLGEADGLGEKWARLDHVVLENNTALDTIVQVVHGAQNVYIRNNAFQFYNANAIELDGYNNQYGRGVANVNVANNTFVNSGTSGRALSVGGSVNGIALVNNLYQANKMYVGSLGTAAVFVNDGSLKSFKTISNNVWPVPDVSKWVSVNATGPVPFAIVGGDLNNVRNYISLKQWNALAQVGTDTQADVLVSSRFVPNAAAARIVDNGLSSQPGVFTDYDNAARPANDEWTIGAIQL